MTAMKLTSKLDFRLTKARFKMLSTSGSKFRSVPKALLVIPMLSVMTFMYCADSENPFEYMTHIELSALNKSIYYDIELNSQGQVGLYHPLDERTGILIGSDGMPYNGTRTAYYSDTGSLFFTETTLTVRKSNLP